MYSHAQHLLSSDQKSERPTGASGDRASLQITYSNVAMAFVEAKTLGSLPCDVHTELPPGVTRLVPVASTVVVHQPKVARFEG